MSQTEIHSSFSLGWHPKETRHKLQDTRERFFRQKKVFLERKSFERGLNFPFSFSSFILVPMSVFFEVLKWKTRKMELYSRVRTLFNLSIFRFKKFQLNIIYFFLQKLTLMTRVKVSTYVLWSIKLSNSRFSKGCEFNGP